MQCYWSGYKRELCSICAALFLPLSAGHLFAAKSDSKTELLAQVEGQLQSSFAGVNSQDFQALTNHFYRILEPIDSKRVDDDFVRRVKDSVATEILTLKSTAYKPGAFTGLINFDVSPIQQRLKLPLIPVEDLEVSLQQYRALFDGIEKQLLTVVSNKKVIELVLEPGETNLADNLESFIKAAESAFPSIFYQKQAGFSADSMREKYIADAKDAFTRNDTNSVRATFVRMGIEYEIQDFLAQGKASYKSIFLNGMFHKRNEVQMKLLRKKANELMQSWLKVESFRFYKLEMASNLYQSQKAFFSKTQGDTPTAVYLPAKGIKFQNPYAK